MSTGILEKISILIKAIKIIKNWHVFVNLYFHKIKSEYVTLELRNGIEIKLRTNSTDLMAFTNVWLVEEYRKPGFEIRNNDVVIDIGAHIGLFALYASQFCRSGKIYCFEPIKENFDMLKMNIELNRITNIIATNIAVSSDDGVVTMYLNDDQSGHSMHTISSRKIEVKSISLKSIFDSNHIECCNFMKLDCEGEEYLIMNALPDSYYAKIKKICMEYHLADIKQKSLDQLIDRFQSFTFIITQTKASASMGLLYAYI